MDPIVNLVISEDFSSQLDGFDFINIVKTTLIHQSKNGQVELSIVIDDDDYIQELNSNYRGYNSSTDVLSFPLEEFDPDSNADYIGDIIISFPTAKRQAKASGHPVENELTLLLTHGILHLLGHDHDLEEDKELMWTAQSEILSTLNCELGRVPGDEDDHL